MGMTGLYRQVYVKCADKRGLSIFRGKEEGGRGFVESSGETRDNFLKSEHTIAKNIEISVT